MTGTWLRPERLDLWLVPEPETAALRGPLALHELDDAERRRADAFRRPADRDRYTVAHIALRRLLAAYLGKPPEELGFARARCPRCGGPHGRPVLAGGGAHYSLSHSHGAVLVGVSGSPVGVDVQRLPRPAGVDACASALHPDERRELRRLAPGERPAAFARLWARKEAYFKGIGVGVGGWTREVYLGGEGPHLPPRPDGWSVVDVPWGREHAAAAAVRGSVPRCAVHRLPVRAVFADGGRVLESTGLIRHRSLEQTDARTHDVDPRADAFHAVGVPGVGSACRGA